jgi:hypothetical protein
MLIETESGREEEKEGESIEIENIGEKGLEMKGRETEVIGREELEIGIDIGVEGIRRLSSQIVRAVNHHRILQGKEVDMGEEIDIVLAQSK